jgi:cysteine synthase
MPTPPAKRAKIAHDSDDIGRPEFGLTARVQDQVILGRARECFRDRNVILPTFEQLRNPDTIPNEVQEALKSIDPDAKHPLNLFRVHWYNGADRKSRVDIPQYIQLPKKLTGVDATILVGIGQRFPMIHAHKVLAAYSCLVPRVITGQFDPTRHRAIWPSTGNYCRGGVAISRILGCRSSAILPEGMSRERFAWLEEWVTDQSDIVRTTGTESNVREIYEKCDEMLGADNSNYNFNQFADFGNHLGHYAVTGPAMEHCFRDFDQKHGGSNRLRAFISATGSAGCIGAGDYLKEHHGSKVVAVESTQCPTLLCNGFGEHNIQGIGDKHVPLIHNVTNTDIVVGISDVDTDSLTVVFNSEAGKDYLRRRGVDDQLIELLPLIGYSGIANTLAAIKTAKYYNMGEKDVLVTVATDSAAMYASEFNKIKVKAFGNQPFDQVNAGEAWGRAILGANTGDLLELTERDKHRIFNLGYYTWVEQRGLSVPEFDCRRQQDWWETLHNLVPKWDKLVKDFNDAVAKTP